MHTKEKGYLEVLGTGNASGGKDEEKTLSEKLLSELSKLKKGSVLPVSGFSVKEGETTLILKVNHHDHADARTPAIRVVVDKALDADECPFHEHHHDDDDDDDDHDHDHHDHEHEHED